MLSIQIGNPGAVETSLKKTLSGSSIMAMKSGSIKRGDKRSYE
jgi:hypothetical protein